MYAAAAVCVLLKMNFLPDVYMCPAKSVTAKRYNRETLEIRYKGKSISDVLDMTVEEAVAFFRQCHPFTEK